MTDSIRNKRILLVGGAGFIGHNLALELKRRGADVSCVDSLEVNNLLSLHASANQAAERDLYLSVINERLELLRAAGVPLYVEDARDYHRLSRLFTQVKPQVVVLLAAVSHASRSNKDPYHTFDHSFRTLENALDNARGGTVEHFIYFSSSMVYGNFQESAVSEESVCNPIGIYGALKFGGEKLVIAYNQVFNLPYTIVRPSALYGERCISRRVGQVFIENAMRGMDLVVRGDGSDALDFTYIGDLVNGVCCCIERPEAKNQIFNLTFGAARTLNDMSAIVRAEFPGTNVNYMERDALMPERGTLNVEKAKQLIGYRPQFPLDVGYRRYIKWYRELFERIRTTPHVTLQPQVNE
jgi:nucleoside-diphosphate-sugar epimerase